uniref:NADH:flavin oxidoreductase/NADH oxidase N-terminal domain-containing protein n=1 Tax=Parascaris univalens TaxID=6257 RepID=A0A915B0C1_PARUN
MPSLLGPPNSDRRYPSQFVPIELLQQPIDFPVAENISATNKIIKAPMTEMIATYNSNESSKNGLPTEALFNLYKKWNDGGAAILVTGSTMITAEDLEGMGNMIIAKEVDTVERRRLFKQLAAIARNGTLIFAQLLHPGRQAIRLREGFQPLDMNNASRDQINDIVERYAYAAAFVKDCGFHGVEINVGMDFALAQLVTATTNSRNDEYGGPLENRTRILFEVINIIRNRVGDDKNFVLGLKLSSLNYEDGYDESEFEHFCKRLDATKLDYVVITGANYEAIRQREEMERDPCRKSESFFVNFVIAVRTNIKRAKIFLCGGFRAADQMWEAIYEGWTDGIMVARPLAAEPDLPRKILNREVTGAKKSLLDESDYGLSEYAAGTQMWQLANDKVLMDLTNANHVEQFRQAMREHNAEKAVNGSDLNHFSFPKFEVEVKLD